VSVTARAGFDVGEIPCRLREHDLTAVRRRADASRSVHVEPDITIADDRRLPCVNAHANTNRQPVESSLPGGGSENGVVRAIEGVEERVTLGIDLVPGAERTAQSLTVFLERLSIRVRTELGEQARGLLDIGEEERDGTAGQLGHARSCGDAAIARRSRTREHAA
jgi:hypothetical protein